jgi:hypothetical protein
MQMDGNDLIRHFSSYSLCIIFQNIITKAQPHMADSFKLPMFPSN